VKNSVIENIVVPLLEVVNTVILLITTPSEKSEYVESFKYLKDPNTGQVLFDYFDGGMVCDRCILKSNPEQCTHKDHLLPPWKSKDKQRLAEVILKDNKVSLLRETR
jgi:hypothetical protein